MKRNTKTIIGLLLSASFLAGSTTLPVQAEGDSDQTKDSQVKIIQTEITADGVFNNDGYGSLSKNVVWKEGSEDSVVEKFPQAALIDREGNFLFPYKDTWLHYYCNDGIVSLVADYATTHYYLDNGKDDPVGFYHLDGTEAFPITCHGASRMIDGMSFVIDWKSDGSDPSGDYLDTYIIDKTGNRIYTYEDNDYTQIFYAGGNDYSSYVSAECTAAFFGDGLLLSWYTEGHCGIFYNNAKGETMFNLFAPDAPLNCSSSRIFRNGFAAVKDGQTGKWGYINTKGELVIPYSFDDAKDFSDGLVNVMKDEQYGYINTSGETVIPFEYEGAYGSGDGLATVKKDGKWGLVNYDNQVVVPFEYDDISSYEGGVAYAIKDGKVSIITGYEPEKDDANPFSDVAEQEYYYNPVLWAVENKITAGTSATTFSPNASCTRAQIVTFLWNAAGQPNPKENNNPFTDVKSGAYYYKAVLWAVENKITAGTSDTTFSPDAECTRGQVVTFLHNYAGKETTDNAENPFIDVKEGAYYYTPVLWAVANKVTAGTSPNTFSPDLTCTRGQIVTFLYTDLGR